MLRPFLLSLVVVGAGAASVGQTNPSLEVATWRWEVSAILDAQRADGVIASPAVVGSGDQLGQGDDGAARLAAPVGH